MPNDKVSAALYVAEMRKSLERRNEVTVAMLRRSYARLEISQALLELAVPYVRHPDPLTDSANANRLEDEPDHVHKAEI
jgi:hypothetical protein